jgi:carboxypeptidase Taq
LSAQVYAAALQAHPDSPRGIACGEFSTLYTWLRDNVYQHGSKFVPNDPIERVPDTTMSMTPYLDYLSEKYAALYRLRGSFGYDNRL